MVAEQTRDMIRKIARKYADVLRQKINLRGLYVYGSFVNGGHDDDSDIDIAVVADNFTGDIVEDTFILMRLRREVDIRIEPHPFLPSDFTAENPLAREVMQKGIRII